VHGYPRPQLVRDDFLSLDGPWAFQIDPAGELAYDEIQFDRTIRVPFAPECPASGVGETGYFNACWYRRTFDTPALGDGQRLILHFGAVDYEATVWVNDRLAVRHEGGYTPFSADVTGLLTDGRQQTIVVRAEDDPLDLSKPRGKQDWKPEPHAIWYYRTSGIWQSVWMERVNATRIDSLKWTPSVEQWQIGLHAQIAGPRRRDAKLRVRLSSRGRPLVRDGYKVTDGQVLRAIQLPDPGIGNARDELLWNPEAPNLIDVELELVDDAGNVVDAVRSYTALRTVHVSADRIVLNGRPIELHMALDQGYWPDGGLTAPDDAAYRRDIELAKAMGFNGVRKHQKIESPRYLYWADKLGLLVWEEMPSAYAFNDTSMRRVARQWTEAIERDYSHPCIVAWVPFNESWGVPDLPFVAQQRHAVQAIYHLTKTLDPTRPVVGNDGWEASATDVIGIHDYDGDPARLKRRYTSADPAGLPQRILAHERPGHRVLILDGFSYGGQPIVLSEFGGIAFSKDSNGTWGYTRARTKDDLAERYAALLAAVRAVPMFAGFCYTQFADTYQEANGLLFMDRTPKFPLEQIACATRGPRSREDHEMYERWKERLMALQRE
jgi:beta-galactosidase/beta-glucuronidase